MLESPPNLPGASGWGSHPDHLREQVGGGALTRPVPGNIPTLDGFRAIAVALVMLSHAGLGRYLPGQFGVTLFFFLSGYLITTMLRRELSSDGRVSFAVFYVRRALRILPPLWLAIGLCVLFSLTGLNNPLNFSGLAFDLAFLTNYFPRSGIPVGLWSLSVEEHFYLLFPLIAVGISMRWGVRAFAAVCAGLCLAELGVRLIEVARLDDFTSVNFWTHTRMDSILFGAILALWNNPVIDGENRLPGKLVSYLIAGGLLMVSFVVRDEVFRQTLRYTVQGLALIFLFNAAIRDDRFAHPLLENTPLRLVAALSYVLYLVHGAFLEATRPLAAQIGTPRAAIVGFALSFAFAYAVRVWMEEPLAKWRRGMERRLRLQHCSRRMSAMKQPLLAAPPDTRGQDRRQTRQHGWPRHGGEDEELKSAQPASRRI